MKVRRIWSCFIQCFNLIHVVLNCFKSNKDSYEPVGAVPSEKPLPRICRLLAAPGDKNINQVNVSGQQKSSGCCCSCSACQNKSPGDVSGEQKSASSVDANSLGKQKSASSVDNSKRKENSTKHSLLDPALPRFGPAYKPEDATIKEFKHEAIRLVNGETPSDEVSPKYFSAIKEVEKAAKQTYDSRLKVGDLYSSDFLKMMIMDGCFFLLSALHILGGGDLLKYPKQHVYFGSIIDEQEITRRLEAMFFVGNQIPCVVICELMKQDFFEKVIEEGIKKEIWHPPRGSLPKMVLYLIVVLPVLKKLEGKQAWIFSKLKLGRHKVPQFREPPVDILHGLYCLVIGLGDNHAVKTMHLDITENVVHDLEAGPEGHDKKEAFHSASVLKNSGIRLRKVKRGIRGIHFSATWVLFGFLYVPPFTFDSTTELMLLSLMNYEIQQVDKEKREVAAYVRFMADLLQKPEDVKILKKKRIIHVGDSVQEDKLPEIFARLGSPQEIKLTEDLRLTRLEVRSYRRPRWDLVILTLFLTIVQTVFAVLSYVKPRG